MVKLWLGLKLLGREEQKSVCFFSRVNPFLYGRTKVLRSDLIQLNDVHQFEDMHTVLGIVYAFQECQQ